MKKIKKATIQPIGEFLETLTNTEQKIKDFQFRLKKENSLWKTINSSTDINVIGEKINIPKK